MLQQVDVRNIITGMLDAYSDVSDLNITVGRPLQTTSSGRLFPVNLPNFLNTLTPYQTEQIALHFIKGNRRLTNDLLHTGSCDLSYSLPDRARFRVNIFSRQGTYSIVMRQLADKIPTIYDLSLPEAFRFIAKEKNGIVLFTGATGSGKTTSLAAILNEINRSESLHVVTLEDPVEYIHPHIKATLNQREMGLDFDSFANGLRAALRQAPNVILVGEMRDRETVEIALNAAETGHLVFSTLHTVDAGHTISRILGMFSTEEEDQIRIRLSETIRWVVCQRLLPKMGGGRVAIFEIMNNNVRVVDAILNGESEGKTFYEIIDDGDAYHMRTFDKNILDWFQAGLITEEVAIGYASRRNVVKRGLDQIKSSRGEKTSDIEGLSMDREYGRFGDDRGRRLKKR